jgi:hypothetical protein
MPRMNPGFVHPDNVNETPEPVVEPDSGTQFVFELYKLDSSRISA